MNHYSINGFSKLNKQEKIDWIIQKYLTENQEFETILKQYWNENIALQNLHDELSENTISNFYMPYSIAPNFLINGKILAIPMVTEESSVVAAASKSAKFWLSRGGFKTQIINTEKLGHTHFIFKTDKEKFTHFFNHILKDKSQELNDYYQLKASFETKDSMGANFINSCLEQFGETLKEEILKNEIFTDEEKNSLQIIMNILSNYTPDCLVRAEVSCKIEELNDDKNISPKDFAEKFYQAVKIAEIDIYRATTHNKGIMNGLDAVTIATGNDFRATEASIHAYACKNGQYSSLSHCSIENGVFRFWIELPISIGVVGGLTGLHPLAKCSLALLGKPNAKELMSILAVSGLAQNFAALRSLITTGIQKGHMKMHLMNILNHLQATEEQKEYFTEYFKDKTISHHEVKKQVEEYRKNPPIK